MSKWLTIGRYKAHLQDIVVSVVTTLNGTLREFYFDVYFVEKKKKQI